MKPALARHSQRCPRARDVRPAPGIDDIGEGEEVMLVSAPAVMEDEEAGGIALGFALLQDHRPSPRPCARPAATTASRGPESIRFGPIAAFD